MYSNTLVIKRKLSNERFDVGLYRNLKEDAFNNFFEFVVLFTPSIKPNSSKSLVSLYGSDGRVLENVVMSKSSLKHIDSLVEFYLELEEEEEDDGAVKINEETYTSSDLMRPLPDRCFIREEKMQKFSSNVIQDLKDFITHVKKISPSKGKAILFSNLSYDKEVAHSPKHWFVWIDEYDVVSFQGDKHFSVHNLDNQLYTYGFQILDESFEHSPVAKKQKRAATSSKQEVRYVFEGIPYTNTDDIFCGLPISIINNLERAKETISDHENSERTMDNIISGNWLKLIVNKLRTYTEGELGLSYLPDEQEDILKPYEVRIKGYTLIFKLKNEASQEEEIIFTFDNRLYPNELNFIEINIKRNGNLEMYSLESFFKPNNPYQIMINFFVIKSLHDIGVVRKPNMWAIHPIYIELFPMHAMYDYTDRFEFRLDGNNYYPRVHFLNDNFSLSGEIDHGGPTAEYTYLLARSIFRPFPERFKYFSMIKNETDIDMDPNIRFPFFPDYVTEKGDKDNIALYILKFFRATLDRHLVIGRVLPDNFFKLVLEQGQIYDEDIDLFDFANYRYKTMHADFYGLLLKFIITVDSNAIYVEVAKFIKHRINFGNVEVHSSGENACLYYEEMHKKRFENKHRLRPVTRREFDAFIAQCQSIIQHMIILDADMPYYSPEKSLEDQDVIQMIPKIFSFWMDDIFFNYAKPFMEFIQHLLCVNFDFNLLDLDIFTTPELILGEKFDRNRIADIIQIIEGDTPALKRRIDILKEHILNPETPEEWTLRLLAAVTGSNAMNSSSKINVKGVSSYRLPSAHTCLSLLVIFNGSDTKYRYLPQDLYLTHSERFLASISNNLIEASTGFGFS